MKEYIWVVEALEVRGKWLPITESACEARSDARAYAQFLRKRGLSDVRIRKYVRASPKPMLRLPVVDMEASE